MHSTTAARSLDWKKKRAVIQQGRNYESRSNIKNGEMNNNIEHFFFCITCVSSEMVMLPDLQNYLLYSTYGICLVL